MQASGKVVEAARAGVWDVAFVAVDAARGADIFFTPPYVLIEGAYLVRDDSPLAMPRHALGAEDGFHCSSAFIEDMKRHGFVADALARSGQGDAAVAPAF